jgi:hypothetical protein
MTANLDRLDPQITSIHTTNFEKYSTKLLLTYYGDKHHNKEKLF